MTTKKFDLKESLQQLDKIVEWFENQDEVDVEAGLQKVKDGAELVKVCKARLAEIENEFQKIRKDVKKSGDAESESGAKKAKETDIAF